MNIYHISEKAGVSIATVSRVLNGSEKVSEKTREKVLKVIKETGYTPNVFARGLGLNTMKTIGILCTSLGKLQIASIVELLNLKLRMAGYDTLLTCCGNVIYDKKNALSHLMDKKTDAVIIVGNDFMEYNPEDNQYIAQAGAKLPIIMINATMEGPHIYSILCDEEKAVYTITENLIRRGNQHNLFLFSGMSSSCLSKMDGYKNANFVQNIPESPEQIHMCKDGHASAYEFVSKLLSSDKTVEGIICTDDAIAAGALKAVTESGRTVPNDVEITGSGFTVLSKLSNPPLTSINCRDDEICKVAVNTIIGIFNGSNMPSKTVIPAEIVKGGSTRS